MSKGPENTFIGSVHRHLPVDLYRMKNSNEYNSGIADCWYSGQQYDLWAEYKFLEIPKRGDTLINLCKETKFLTALQQEWLRGRHNEGRNVVVIVGCKDGGVIFMDRAWENPIRASDFKPLVKPRKDIAAWIASYVNG